MSSVFRMPRRLPCSPGGSVRHLLIVHANVWGGGRKNTGLGNPRTEAQNRHSQLAHATAASKMNTASCTSRFSEKAQAARQRAGHHIRCGYIVAPDPSSSEVIPSFDVQDIVAMCRLRRFAPEARGLSQPDPSGRTILIWITWTRAPNANVDD